MTEAELKALMQRVGSLESAVVRLWELARPIRPVLRPEDNPYYAEAALRQAGAE